MGSNWFSLHTHSQFSTLDGMTPVPELVHKAAKDGRPALGMSDHGNMAATTQLYKACAKAGILAFPGFEAYVLDPAADDPMHDSTKRYHLLLHALDLEGYKALVKYMNLSHTRPRFSRFPRLTINDLAALGKEAGDHVTLTTGCYFGLAQQRLVNDGQKAAERVIKTWAQYFPHTIVEVQNHGIIHDDEVTDHDIVATLMRIADKLGLPVIATQDSHYTDQSQKAVHALMKRMVYGGAEDEFPGDSFHLASADWVREHYTARQWARIEEGCKYLLDRHDLKIPALDVFTAQVPSMDPDPNGRLWKLCNVALKNMVDQMPLTKAKKYTDRLKAEIETIKTVGMADYFLLVLRVVQWCRDNGVCIEARGSANGGLVCFLLGITQVDPLKWVVPFERFISADRIKPPDIDIDIEDARRQELLAHLREEFTTVAIGTWSELGMTVDKMTGEESGSVFRTYQTYLRTRAMSEAEDIVVRKYNREVKRDPKLKPPTKAAIETAGKQRYAQQYGWIQHIEDVKKFSPEDYDSLRELARMRSVYRSYGTHAGGVLLGTESFPHQDYIPQMLVASVDNGPGQPKGKPVTQFDMDDVEEWGLLKLDILGQSTLTVMRMAQTSIMERDDAPDTLTNANDFTWIPENDPKACAILRSGMTDTGIFHFEGYTKAKGGRELGVKSTRDAVLATAIYMPGATDGGAKDAYLRRRAGREEITYLHPIFEKVLAETLGVMVYQDQPLSILREMGMAIASVNLLYKVLKDSGKGAVERNRERLASLRKEFDYLCAKHGIDAADEAWAMVTSFNAYGMNKAHAAGYGIRSYRCAYLKAHYPLEYMAALLAVWVGDKTKEPRYLREARRLGFRFLSADINESEATYSISKGRRPQIRKGLVSIKGVGWAIAEAIAENSPYESIDDLVARCRPGGRMLAGGKAWEEEGRLSGVLQTLDDVGVLDNIK